MTKPHLTPDERSANARRAAQIRWSKDQTGLDGYIVALAKRASALTHEQRARLAAVIGARL